MENKNILVCVWGYSMRMVSFFKVIKETEKTILVREVESKTIEQTGFLRGKCVPTEIEMKERDYSVDVKENESHPLKPIEIRLYKRGNEIFSKKNGFIRLFHYWDGKPEYFDHCD